MEVSGKRSSHSTVQTNGVLCDPCRRDHEDENAEFYCTVSNEHLCRVCGKAHRKAKSSQSHLLLDSDSMPIQKRALHEESVCSKQDGKPLECYCQKHQDFSCSICATNDHKEWTVEYIDAIANGFEKSTEYTALIKGMDDLIQLVRNTKDKSNENKKDLKCMHADFLSGVKKFRSEINTILDSLESTSLCKAQITSDSESHKTDHVTSSCDTMLDDVHEMSSDLEKLNKYQQKRQLVICSKKTQTRVENYRDTVEKLSKLNQVQHYKFQPNEELMYLLKSLNNLGEVRVRNKGKHDNHVMLEKSGDKLISAPKKSVQIQDDNKGQDKKVGEPEDDGNLLPVSRQSHTPSYLGTINVRLSTDSLDCWITGGVMIDDNDLALVDRCNACVKIVDVNDALFMDAYSDCINRGIYLPGEPWDITCVNQVLIVVTCCRGKLVFLKVGRTLSVQKELKVGITFHSIVYTNKSFIVTCKTPHHAVKILNMDGEILKTFRTDNTGTALFNDPESVALSTDQQTIYVSDLGNHTVTSITMDGTIQDVYTADNLRGPAGLTVDMNGNVYVAAFTSRNIHRISADARLHQVLLERPYGPAYPQMVTYCKKGHKLYISNGSMGEESNFLCVFQL